jgi:hypothetical protein
MDLQFQESKLIFLKNYFPAIFCSTLTSAIFSVSGKKTHPQNFISAAFWFLPQLVLGERLIKSAAAAICDRLQTKNTLAGVCCGEKKCV